MSFRSRLGQACIAAALLFASGRALADKVAVLPFLSAGNATSAELDGARQAARAAVLALSHRLPTDSEMLTAQMSAKDGTADSGQEYRAAGRASSSDWTVAGHVDAHGATYRLETDVCQVATGRIESLAREVDPAQSSQQIKEMLALLLRPEGIANADIPWERAAAAAPAVAPAPSKTPAAPPVVVTPPPAPAKVPAVKHTYAEGHPLALGLGVGELSALHRPANAVGSSAAFLGSGRIAYAFDAVPGLEIAATFTGAIAGPGSISIDGGARYAIAIAPAVRFFLGPELDAGAFLTTGGDKTGRFLLHGAVFAAMGLGERVQLELAGDLEGAFGGASTLLLGGGTLRGLVRF